MFSLHSKLAEIMGCKNSKHSRSVEDEKKEAKKIIEVNNSTPVAGEKVIQNGQQHHSSSSAGELKPKNSTKFRVSSLKEKFLIRHSSSTDSPQPPSPVVEIIIPNQ